ncbi:amino acid adenylation domain-containing protein [Aeoliella sp.]|uniref:amino acid adenylation domain-containing protein n=1 Tax=Aeoliella sp. TaxID=2795800 RepID=UPI003CCB832D
MLSTNDKQSLTELSTGVKSGYPRRSAIQEVFEEVVDDQPSNIALICGQERITYQELDQRANHVAQKLDDLGVRRGTIVAFCLPRSVEAIAVQLGVLKAGGAYMPLPSEYPPDRLRVMLEQSSPLVLVTSQEFVDRFPDPGVQLLLWDDITGEGTESGIERLDSGNSAEDSAYVMFTSGTTGVPKGVVVPHRAVTRLVCNPDYVQIEKDDRFLQYAPLAFDAATFEIWGPLLNGATLVLAPAGILTLRELSDCIFEHGVTTLWLTAGLFHEMATHNIEGFKGLRNLLAGGDVLSVEAVSKVKQAYPSLRLVNGYGPTENTTFSCCYTVDNLDRIAGGVPIGKPIANSDAFVLDDGQQLVPIGEEGELYVGGDGLALGYLGDSQLTSARFAEVELGPDVSRRLYRTGDRVRWNIHGDLEFLGRVDSQFKLLGFRIEPGDIEAVLRRHESIHDASVGVTTDAVVGKRLLAFVVSEQSASLEVEDLQAFASENLPHYMVPSEFRTLERLPLNANGKVDRAKLFEQAAAPETPPVEAPQQTECQNRVAQLWADVLPIARLDSRMTFLESGGDSLRAIQLAARFQAEFNVELTIDDRFLNGTTNSHALELERRASEKDADKLIGPVYGESADDDALSPAQARLWFLQQFDPSCQAYNIALCYKVAGDVNPRQLERCLAEVVRRHDSLRTRFIDQDGRPLRHVQESSEFPFDYTDLLGSGTSLEDWKLEHSRQSLNCDNGPLLRVSLARTAKSEYFLLLLVHHLVFDGWSEKVLFRELAALIAPRPSSADVLPSLPATYSDFVRSQRLSSASARYESDRTYWCEHLQGVPEVLQLPTDHPRPPQPTWNGRTLFYKLPEGVAAAVDVLAKTQRSTPFVVLLAAFKAWLYRQSGQDDFVVGTAIAQRQRPEFEPLIGFFANTVALRTNLSGNPPFEQFVSRVGQTVQQAIQHQGFPFDQVVSELQIERNPSIPPLVQVAFVMHEGALDLPGLHVVREPVDPGTAKFDLTFYAVKDEGGYQLWVEYNSDLFDESTVRSWMGSYEILLAEIARDPAQSIERDLHPPQQSARSVPSNGEGTQPPTRALSLESVESELAKIWENLTGERGIRGKDNFFQVGGHSLMAVQLAAQIESTFGKSVSIKELFQHPTLLEQTMLIAGRNTKDGDALIRYREGADGGLILLPNIAGRAYAGEWVLRHLPQDLGLFAIDLDTDDLDVKRTTVDQLAARCVQLLEHEGVQAPFRLLGYSFGGLLAYETAIQLQRRGHEVSFVGIIDTGPAHSGRMGVRARLGVCADFCSNATRWFAHRSKQRVLWSTIGRAWSDYRARRTRIKASKSRAANTQLESEQNSDSDSVQDVPFWLGRKPKDPDDNRRNFVRAYLNYHPAPYEGRVTLFRAQLRSLIHHFATDAGWRSVPVSDLDVRLIPGSHVTMLEHPHCLVLAKEVQNALESSGLTFSR